MTLNQSALLELTEAMRTADDGKLMRTLLQTILQALVDAEATEQIEAGMHEQNDTRTTQRNGTRTKVVSTTSGDLSVKIAKTRIGSFFPTLLHPRRRIDVALHAVVVEAYVHGVSTRKVDDLVVAMGAEAGISKSEVIADLRRAGRRRGRVQQPRPGRPDVPLRLPGRDLLQSSRRWRQGRQGSTSGLPGGRDRHRGQR